jgi:hypothetical protein
MARCGTLTLVDARISHCIAGKRGYSAIVLRRNDMSTVRLIVMDWIEIQRMLPQRWKRKLLVEDGGRVFMSAAIGFKDENEGMIAAADAGQTVVTFKGHRYIDADWVATVLPSIKENVAGLKRFANKYAAAGVTQCL